ncbi:hypothetical protein DSLASN_43200 [Desulfoluna limicola]|uniref:Uncharacterized protein n=1 Tax=Desulfoluna limicola TaxID=2810562 RepID=A0ABM7PN39_9BACT|nr:hypothetical protein DSLASN_43200 [Desulfoluna limicola]
MASRREHGQPLETKRVACLTMLTFEVKVGIVSPDPITDPIMIYSCDFRLAEASGPGRGAVYARDEIKGLPCKGSWE